MPLYEYKCSNCGYYFEKLQKFSDSILKECPECKTESLEKLISLASFTLKGAGWHKTDYKAQAGSSKTSDKPHTHTGNSCACCPKAQNNACPQST